MRHAGLNELQVLIRHQLRPNLAYEGLAISRAARGYDSATICAKRASNALP